MTARSQRDQWGRAVRGLLLLGCAALLAGCGPQYGKMAEARAAYAREGLGPVVIAAVEDPLGPGFAQGIELAVAAVNADGGLLGRPVQVRRFPGSEDFQQARSVALEIARDPRISAVLGHRRSEVAVPASVIYERAEVLFLPSFATAEQLTRHGFKFVLRTLPDNAAMAAQTASILELFGHRRIAVLHSRDDYARELAFLFQDEARARGLDIVFSASFFASETNYRSILGQLNAVQFDALYLSTGDAAGARLLAQLRQLGFEQPVFGSDRLANGEFSQVVGAAGDRTLVPSVYDVDAPGPRNRAFVAAYREAYGTPPDQGAAQGFDAAHLFADTVRSAGSAEPQVLATTARYAPPRAGVTGIFAYDPNGNIFGKIFEFRVLRFGRWWPLPGVTAPYRLASFRTARLEMRQEQEADQQAVAQTPAAGADLTLAAASDAGSAAPPANADPAPMGEPAAAAPPAAPVAPPVAGAGADGAGQAAGAPDDLRLEALTAARLSIADRNRIWLALAHEILRFKRLGLVVPQTTAGSAAVGLARTLAEERGFTVETCELPESGPESAPARAGARSPVEPAPGDRAGLVDADPLARAALGCWSRLARMVDAMLVVPDAGLPPALVRRLNHTLRDFGVPSFALAQTLDADLGLTLALVASGVDLDDPQVALRFGGILRGMQVHALNRKLTNLPAVSVDLDALATLGIRPDPRLLTLVSSAMEPTFFAAAPVPPADPATPRPAPAAGAEAAPPGAVVND